MEGRKGLHACRRLIHLEKRLGFRSSFNFVPEGSYRVSRALRDELTREGFEVGIHGLHHDGKLYGSRATFLQRAASINRYAKEWGCAGFRSPFMHHNLEWLHDLEIEYDTSTFDTDPFEPQPDGVGTIFPFWKDGADGRGYVEMPYTLAQDSTLFLLLRESSIRIWQAKARWVAAHGGMILVNTHPDYMDYLTGSRGRRRTVFSLYEEFLWWVRNELEPVAWCALPREVSNFIRDWRKIA